MEGDNNKMAELLPLNLNTYTLRTEKYVIPTIAATFGLKIFTLSIFYGLNSGFDYSTTLKISLLSSFDNIEPKIGFTLGKIFHNSFRTL